MLVSTSAILDEYSSGGGSGSSSSSSSSCAGVVREALQEDELYQDPKQVHTADDHIIINAPGLQNMYIIIIIGIFIIVMTIITVLS